MGEGRRSESLERHVAHARAQAARNGWSVANAHGYADDGISGAELGNRRAPLQGARLLRARCSLQAYPYLRW